MTQASQLIDNMRLVEPDAIESGLDNLWRENNAAALAAGGHAAARSSVLTLVVYANSETAAVQSLQAIETMNTQHPSRCIIVMPTAKTKNGRPLEAYIRTRATSTNGISNYGEEIVLCATPDASQHLAGSILPLIASGLPSFLWWEGVPPWHTEIFEATLDGFDRVLVDTAYMPQSEQNLLALEDLVRRKKSSIAISDFNFTRFNPWRELVAQFFDPEDQRVYLSGIDHVTIEYAASTEDAPSNPTQAYLFAGWLAARLGWRPLSAASDRLGDGQREHTLLDSGGRKIMLELNPRHGVALGAWIDVDGTSDLSHASAVVAPGALMSVHIRSTVNGQRASFSAAREANLRNASTHSQVPSEAIPSQTVYLPTLGELSSLSEVLMRLNHDTLFEESLTAITPALESAVRRMRR